jgi:hypothetical protein
MSDGRCGFEHEAIEKSAYVYQCQFQRAITGQCTHRTRPVPTRSLVPRNAVLGSQGSGIAQDDKVQVGIGLIASQLWWSWKRLYSL